MPHCPTKSENKKKKQIEKYTRKIEKLQAKIDKYTQDKCPHTGVDVSKKDKKDMVISTNKGIPLGTYEIYTCCDDCRQKIQKSLNDRGKNSPYFDGMENGCIRLKIGPQATDGNPGEHAQTACPK